MGFLVLRVPPECKVTFQMPRGMTVLMALFYKLQGEGAIYIHYRPPGIRSPSITEEDM